MFSSVYAQQTDSLYIEGTLGKIYGTLRCPKAKEKVPVALIVAGSGPTDRNGNQPPYIQCNSYKILAEALEKKGIASLCYDKWGAGQSLDTSKIDESKIRFHHYIDDAILWLKYLQKDKRFSQIIVIGHSEGSLIGMIVAQKGIATKYVSLSGVGIPANEILKKQLEVIKDTNVYNEVTHSLSELVQGRQVDTMSPMLQSIFRPSVQPYLISWFKYNPAEEISKVNIPCLIVQGTTDLQVGVDNAVILSKALPTAQLEIIQGMNHILKQAPIEKAKNIATYSNPDLPLDKTLVKSIVHFILSN
jgi:pimeloyl-ACP methyl ester carboxylesterase